MRLTAAAKAVRYRVGQFLQALTAQHTVSKQRLSSAAQVLSPKARALFTRQAAHDQRHALAVYESLLEAGHTHEGLLAAALLHDVGKAASQAAPWQRGLYVLAERLAPWTLDQKISSAPASGDGTENRKQPLAIYARHAQIGARWAEEAGCSTLTIELIRYHEHPLESHQTERDRLLEALQAADNAN